MTRVLYKARSAIVYLRLDSQMSISFAEFAVGSATAWFILKIARFFFYKSVLDNIPGPPSRSVWTGNFLALFDPKGWDFHADIAQKYGGVVRIDGPIKYKILYIFDPLALYHITVKDQPIYERNSTDLIVGQIMFGEGLLSVGSGKQHRKQRKMLNPVFNVVHLRQLTPIFYTVTHKLRVALTSKVADGPSEVEILRWMMRCAVELMGQGGLGYSFDNLTDNSDDPVHPYSSGIREMQPLIMRLSLAFNFILPWACKFGTPSFQRAVIDRIPWTALREFRDVVDIMDSTTHEIYDEKKRLLDSDDELSKAGGKDIISILMKENSRAEEEARLSEAEILGQMSTLIFAAAETTSIALARTLLLLAQNPDIQDRLRAELTEAQRSCTENLPYDMLMQLPFLEAVCRETLRLHPPSPMVTRTTTADVILPLAHPVRGLDGAEMHALHVPRDTDIMISIHAANRDPRVWGPDAAEWKPSRWLAPQPASVIDAHIPGVYQHLMTFSGGPRACIGFKFAQLEMKVVLSVLITAFKVSPPKDEVEWDLGFVATPRIPGGKDTQLPLVLTSINSA
ncbi:cytochrome P450 [Mycena latifolia]|nr:cytochrome P450 [Mycena latifolia]